jgi:hypothetical protein
MTRTQVIGGRLFTVECAEPLAAQADWLLGVLRGLDAQHSPLSDGTKIAIGWSLVTLRERDREVDVLAPKYDGNPFVETTSDLTTTLLIQMEQNELPSASS